MLAALALAVQVQVAAPVPELAPGTTYDPAIPTLEEVVGHDPREVITAPADVLRYMEALVAAAPERTRLIRYATSWEGRPLVALVIGDPTRMADLEAVQADLNRLADPRGLSDADAEALIGRTPVVTALMHGVHGNEISSTGAAMAEAYHLLAARNDQAVDLILRESLVIIDPVENPDGRNRFVMHNAMAESRWPDAEPVSAAHDEPWPGGRVNHYLFDLNRDLFIQSQPETAGRVGLFLDFRPHVVVDLHEMGGNSTYFFPPTAPPVNPWYGQAQIDQMDLLGSAIAEAFDRRGFAYFNRDVYDLFYPGYVDGWPTAHGGLGMTFEQASARSLRFRKDDGTLLTYGQGVVHHFTAALAAAETAARHRERLLRDFLAYRRAGVDDGRQGPAEYVLHSSHDPGMAERLARMLVANGVEVRHANGPVRVAGRTLPERGTFIVPLAQPASRFARNLLDAHVQMDTAFIRRQIERRARRENDEIYDLTAWSQPLLWDVEAILSDAATGAAGDLVPETPPEPSAAPLPEAGVGYLMPWGTNTAAAVAEALRQGVRMRAATEPFVLAGRRWAVGTVIVRTGENEGDLRETLSRVAGRHGAEVVPIDDTYVREGTSLGSRSVRALREPRVLLVFDEPGSTYSVGWAWYVLERRYGQRTTVVRAESLGRAPLAEYDVIVLPSGNYAGVLDDDLVDRLQDWMRGGGTLITMANSSVWATRAGLLASETERRGGRAVGTDPPEPETPEQPIDYLEAIDPVDEPPESVAGAILGVVMDTTHWLAAGMDGATGVLVDGSRVFRPLTLDEGTNVGRYEDIEDLVLSGVVWEEARPQLANKAFLMHQGWGRGRIVAFAEDPNYRAYTEATSLLFMNAVLLGPGR